MKLNFGTADRVLRVVVGFAIGAAGLHFESWLGLIGLVPLGTALTGWCPAYVAGGISICRSQPEGS